MNKHPLRRKDGTWTPRAIYRAHVILANASTLAAKRGEKSAAKKVAWAVHVLTDSAFAPPKLTLPRIEVIGPKKIRLLWAKTVNVFEQREDFWQAFEPATKPKP